MLADPSRRRILELLKDADHTVGAVVAATGLSQPAVSKQLRLLREAGVVEVLPDGQRRWYRLHAEPLLEVAAWLEPFQATWARRLDALEKHLDDKERRPWTEA